MECHCDQKKGGGGWLERKNKNSLSANSKQKRQFCTNPYGILTGIQKTSFVLLRVNRAEGVLCYVFLKVTGGFSSFYRVGGKKITSERQASQESRIHNFVGFGEEQFHAFSVVPILKRTLLLPKSWEVLLLTWFELCLFLTTRRA